LRRVKMKTAKPKEDPVPLIMVIDDETGILEMLSDFFLTTEMDLITCQKSETAIDIALKHKPDLFLLDLCMPVVDGVQLCRALRERPEFTTSIIVMMSAMIGTRSQSDEIVRGLNAGANDYLLKPFELVELLARIKSWMKIKQSRDKLSIAANLSREALRREQACSEVILTSMTDAVFVVGTDGLIQSCNQRAGEALGCSTDKVSGREICSIFSPDAGFAENGLQRLQRMAKGSGAEDIDTAIYQDDGGVLHVSLSCSSLPQNENGETKLLLVARDISDRHQLQNQQRKYAAKLEKDVEEQTKEIRASEENYRAIFENVEQALIITSASGEAESFNRAAGKLFQWKDNEKGSLCNIFCQVTDCPGREQILSAVQSTGSCRHECVAIGTSGQKLPLHISASLLHGEDEDRIFWVISDLSEQKRLQESVAKAGAYAKQIISHSGTTGKLIGRSAGYDTIRDFISDCAGVPLPVLILGESGTGKEVVARSIHFSGSRAGNPFVVLDCAALQASLLERELFGHVKGAFTGAIEDKPGLVEVADGGTLFVDEIGEMPLELQTNLLRVLERGEYRPVGSTDTSTVDIRVISATNRNLVDEVEAGNFRKDLYYRLNVLTIDLPPLRQRIDDVPLLAQYFLENSRVTLGSRKTLRNDTISCLNAYSWPGNIRELANVIERAVILSRDADYITPEHLPPELREFTPELPTQKKKTITSLKEAEAACVKEALAAANGNQSKAAELLGISRMTLWRKIQALNIVN